MLNQEELQKIIACAVLLPGPGPEALKEVCQSHLDALVLLDEYAHRTVQQVSRPESICILCGEERPLEKTILEYPLLKLCCACFDNFQTLTRLPTRDKENLSVIGTLQIAEAKIDEETRKLVLAALQYGKQHWGSKT